MAIKLLGIDPLRVTASAEHDLGAEYEDSRGGRFTPNRIYYVRAGVALNTGDAVILDIGAGEEPAVATPSTAAGQAIVGIAHVAIPLNQFGFITTYGKVNANVSSAVVAGDLLGTSSVAGRLERIAVIIPPTLGTLASILAVGAGKGIQAVDSAVNNLAEVWVF